MRTVLSLDEDARRGFFGFLAYGEGVSEGVGVEWSGVERRLGKVYIHVNRLPCEGCYPFCVTL